MIIEIICIWFLALIGEIFLWRDYFARCKLGEQK